VLHALVGALVERCKSAKAAHFGFVTYALRLPDEFTLLAISEACKVQPKLAALPDVQKWIYRARQKGISFAA
jgi:hypothetical protein